MTAPLSTRVSGPLCRWRWELWAHRGGTDHPRARAWFGRFVASCPGRTITPRAGWPAWVAFNRHTQSGYMNRSYRRHRTPDWAVQL